LKSCPKAGTLHTSVAKVRFGCQGVVVQIAAPELGADGFTISFENRGGRIAASIEQTGWLNKLTAPQREAVLAAVRGLFDMAAAELYVDRERSLEPEPTGDSELFRPYRWSEWVKRWEGKR
jgi:hypothetical protein